MRDAAHEGAVSHYVQTTTFGHVYRLRNALLVGRRRSGRKPRPRRGDPSGPWLVAALVGVGTSTVSRALFYVVVVPTTMPGAFFWKNKGFEQHARDLGLAANRAVGVAPNGH